MQKKRKGGEGGGTDMYLVKEEKLASDTEREVIYLDEGLGEGGGGADLSEERDWLLSHGVCIPNVGLDDFSKWLFHSLQRKRTAHQYMCEEIYLHGQQMVASLSESEEKSSLHSRFVVRKLINKVHCELWRHLAGKTLSTLILNINFRL